MDDAATPRDVGAAALPCAHCGHQGSTDHGALTHGIACGQKLLGRLAGDVPHYLDNVGGMRPDLGRRLDQLAPSEVDEAISTLRDAGHVGDGKEVVRRLDSSHLLDETVDQLRRTEVAAGLMLASKNPNYCGAGCTCDDRPTTATHQGLCGTHDLSDGTPEEMAEAAFWAASECLLEEHAIESVRKPMLRWVDEVGAPIVTDPTRAAAACNVDPLGLNEGISPGLDM